MRSDRCILLFSRSPQAEARAKGLGGAGPLFRFARRRVERAARQLEGVDLFEPVQRGSGFAARLEDAFRQARERGYRAIVAVPCDAPALGARQLEAAFEALDRAGMVLGPAPDGGVYLLGIAARTDDGAAWLPAAVRWRTRHVLDDLRAARPGAALLPAWIDDVDDLAGLRRLAAEASGTGPAAGSAGS
ncbi:MAG TPA: DUF2064 domain-containing protein, partial [Candidatus Polarisedimenticolia bacterium]|nr:DUF2064 domain-containing protein [Candidatus Polarisedimenticolia bacterium]